MLNELTTFHKAVAETGEREFTRETEYRYGFIVIAILFRHLDQFFLLV